MSARGDCFEGVSQPAATVLKEDACGVSAISHALSVELLVLLVVIFVAHWCKMKFPLYVFIMISMSVTPTVPDMTVIPTDHDHDPDRSRS